MSGYEAGQVSDRAAHAAQLIAARHALAQAGLGTERDSLEHVAAEEGRAHGDVRGQERMVPVEVADRERGGMRPQKEAVEQGLDPSPGAVSRCAGSGAPHWVQNRSAAAHECSHNGQAVAIRLPQCGQNLAASGTSERRSMHSIVRGPISTSYHAGARFVKPRFSWAPGCSREKGCGKTGSRGPETAGEHKRAGFSGRPSCGQGRSHRRTR